MANYMYYEQRLCRPTVIHASPALLPSSPPPLLPSIIPRRHRPPLRLLAACEPDQNYAYGLFTTREQPSSTTMSSEALAVLLCEPVGDPTHGHAIHLKMSSHKLTMSEAYNVQNLWKLLFNLYSSRIV